MMILAVVFYACSDAYDLLKAGPSFVQVGFVLKESTHAQLDFTKGSISIREFEFHGQRDNAPNVHFSKVFDTKFDSPLSVNPVAIPLQQYDVPQGVYSLIDITLSLFSSTQPTTPGLWVEGTLTRSDNSVVPVRIEIAPDVKLEVSAESSAGSNSLITLIENNSTTATIGFSPDQWFNTISISSLEGATLTSVNNEMVLLISKEVNPDLYQTAVNNIEENTKAIFMN